MKLTLLVLALCAGVASADPFDLGMIRQLPVGAGPSAVAVEDFDRDGNLDFAVTQRDVDSVSVFLGLGGGRFAPPARYATGDFPIAIAAADLNEDGRLDLAIVNGAGNTVTIWLGAVFGTFSNRLDYPASAQPTAIAIGDLNGDTHPDVAITSFSGNSVRVLKGGFQTGINGTYFTVPTGTGPRGVAVVDFNRDGLLDLVTADVTADSVSVLMNSFNGFGAHQEAGITGDPSALAIGDLNNDGWPDVAVTLSGAGAVAFFEDSGGTLFYQTIIVVENNPDCVAIADVTGDNVPDVIAGHSTNAFVSVASGNGDGTFQTGASVSTGGSGVPGLGIGDFDGDGLRDIVVPSFAPATLSVFYNNHYNDQGPFGYSTSSLVTGFGVADIAAADLNGDAHDDVVITARQSGWVRTFLNDGTGGFPDANAAYIFGQFGANALEVADLNGDLLPDIAITTGQTSPNDTNRVRVFLNQGGGAFEPYTDYDIGAGVRTGLGVGDLTNDGKLDLITTHAGTTVAQILAGNGLGAFTLGPTLTTAGGTTTLDLADVNGGGLDVFVGGADRVSAFLANGAGGFSPRVDYMLGSAVVAIVHGDFDKDGKMDLAVANAGGTVSILRGDGLGGFTNTLTIPIPGAALFAMTGADFNLDGDVDLMVGRDDIHAMILYGLGNGTFSAPVSVQAGNPIKGFATGLFDGNATRDVVFAWASTATSPRATKAKTRTVLTVTPNPTAVGQSITYKATVTTALPDSTRPAGTVFFFDGTTLLGSAAVSNGAATLTQAGNFPWERKISARFKPDPNGSLLGSLSRPVDHFTYIPSVGVAPSPSTLSLAPLRNPAPGHEVAVRLTLPSPAPAFLTMVDVRGRVVTRRSVTAGVVRLDGAFAPGVYLLRVEQDGRVATVRVVVL